jgi:hypothetical protein
MGQAITLRYKPVDLYVLPLFIVLISFLSLGALEFDPKTGFDLGRFDLPLCSGMVRLEYRFLSARHNLVLQSILLATPLCVRSVVRRWRRQSALDSHSVTDRNDSRRCGSLSRLRLS